MAAAEQQRDLFGLGWRPELSATILMNLDRVDVIEIIADDWFDAPRRKLTPLLTLAKQVPVTLHATSLGLASSEPVAEWRCAAIARLVDAIQPVSWSEHLAFVRAGGIEIGHLAAPPRTAETIAGTLANVARAQRVVGSAPLLENVATLIEPPGSDREESTWVAEIISSCAAELLLDLHNLHANALNFGFDARASIMDLPLERVAQVHLAGGRMIGPGSQRRMLDDHMHDVPEEVFELLTFVTSQAPRPLTVLLERDGNYPTGDDLLLQLDRARAAVAAGRALR